MTGKKVLFISGSIGLGHVVRDVMIANALRKLVPDIQIHWLASHPVDEFLRAHGEIMAPGAEKYANDNIPAEKVAINGRLNLLSYLMRASKDWIQNAIVYTDITRREQFDLVIGDETYEIITAISLIPKLKKTPFVILLDFIGLDAMTANPLEKLGIYMWNLVWWNTGRRPGVWDLALFVGEKDDIPERTFGPFLPSRRTWAEKRTEFIGHILRFGPADLKDKSTLRAVLGYGPEPLIVGSAGGTAAGRPLLELFAQTFPLLRRDIPGIRMLLVCGPRIDPDSIPAPEGVEKVGFIPDLYRYFAACDLALVMGGGSSTLELTALQRPFIYFPLQGHCEQELSVASRLERLRAGVRMNFGETTPEILANAVKFHLGKDVTWSPIHSGGEAKAASLIASLLTAS